MLALQGTLRGFGPLIGFEGNARLLALQIFIAMVSITSLIIAAIVSQLTQSLLEKEILLREIHHRVKNNLQVISSLLSLQHDSRHEGNASDQLQESQSRIKSMALIHESLYKASDLTRVDAKAYLRRLVDYLWSAYGGRGRIVERDLETDEVALSVDTAVPCGLIVNELVTNALRHAFPDGRAGRIWISLRQSAAGWLTLEVKDNGIGAPASVVSQETGGLGLRLVRALSEQLGGKLTVSHEGGTTFAVMFAEGRTLPPPERSQPGAIHPSKRLAPARTR